MNYDINNPIIDEASEFLNMKREYIVAKIYEMENNLHKIWNQRNPQTYSEIIDFYKKEELHFFNVLQFNLWSNAQMPFVDFNKYPIKTCFEFGCGIGTTALLLAEMGFEVDIADANIKLVEFTKFRLNKRGYKCNIINIDKYKPLEKSYDLITTIDVLEHVLNPIELMVHFREYSKYWYVTNLNPAKISQHLCLWNNDRIIDIIKAIGWNPLWLAEDSGRGFFE